MNRYTQRPPHSKSREGHRPPLERAYLTTKYIIQLVRDKTPLVIKLKTNQEIRGYIQYYDKDFIRVTCPDGNRFFIFHHDIKYFYEDPTPR
jgi:hypothetical protein